LWNTKSGEVVLKISYKNWVNSVSFSSTGKYFASGSVGEPNSKGEKDQGIRLWEIKSDSNWIPIISDDSISWSHSVSFSDNEEYFASGNGDGSIYLWRIAEDNAEKHALKGGH